jgi:hypothetical protein
VLKDVIFKWYSICYLGEAKGKKCIIQILKYAVLVIIEKEENLAVQIGMITRLVVYVVFAFFLKKMDYVRSIEKIIR